MITNKKYHNPNGYKALKKGWIEEQTEQEELSDDLDDFLREIYQDTGYDDQDLEGMMEEWEDDES